MKQNNGRSGMPSSSSSSSGKKMKVAGSNYESNSNDIQFGANILNNASSCMFPDRLTPPNNAMIAPAYSPPNFVNRLHQPQHRVNGDDGNYIDPYFRTFPPGMRFCPKDEELVVSYLIKKMRNEPLPKNRIHTIQKPLLKSISYFKKMRGIFSPLDSKSIPTGKYLIEECLVDFGRLVLLSRVPLEHSNIEIKRRSLDFYEGKGDTGRRTDWKMQEYYPETNDVSSTEGMRLNDCILCRIYLKAGKQQAEAKTSTRKESRNDGNSTASHGSADSRNCDHTSSANINSQHPANHGASASDTIEVSDETQALHDYSMDQRCYADSRDQILASMDPEMYTLPDAIEGTSRGFSQSIAFGGPSSSTPLTVNVTGMINGPSFSMPLTMHGAGNIEPSSSKPLTMHVAGLNGATSSMHGAGLNGPNSSKPPTTLPGNTMDADDHLAELDSLPDDAFNDDDLASILEMCQHAVE